MASQSLFRQPSHIPNLIRSFSTTPASKATFPKISLDYAKEDIPPYPYGEARFYKQCNRGLYGGAMVRFGNKVSEKNEIKTRRRWDPNTQYKKLYSDACKEWLDIRVTTRVMRTIKKVGGLDEYLLGDKSARIKELGIHGWKLRFYVLEAKRKEAARLAAMSMKREMDEDWVEEDEALPAPRQSRRLDAPGRVLSDAHVAERENILRIEKKVKMLAIEAPGSSSDEKADKRNEKVDVEEREPEVKKPERKIKI